MNVCNCAKASSTNTKKINTIRKKWRRDLSNLELLKFETRQLHHFIDKLLADGRVTLDELRKHVNSRDEAKSILNINSNK